MWMRSHQKFSSSLQGYKMSSLEGARVALLACGSYNPPTVMHLRMFEAARSFLESRYDCNVVEGIISPVADSFAKPGLLPACNRYVYFHHFVLIELLHTLMRRDCFF